MSEDIKACPYCGSKDTKVSGWLGERFGRCNSCGTTGPDADNESDAILLWNAAANALAAKDREIEQLRNGIDEALREAPDENSYSVYLDMVSVFRGEIKQLREKVDLYKDRAEESMRLWTENRSMLQDRIEELFVERDEAMREITELREERDASNDQIAAKDAEITEHQRHVAAVMQREANAIAEIERQRLSHTHYYDRYHSALAEIEKLRKEHQDYINDVVNTNTNEWTKFTNNLKNERDKAIAEIEKLSDENKKLSVAWRTAEFGCTNLRAERDEAIKQRDYWNKAWENNYKYWQREYGNLSDKYSETIAERDEARKVARHWYNWYNTEYKTVKLINDTFRTAMRDGVVIEVKFGNTGYPYLIPTRMRYYANESGQWLEPVYVADDDDN
jgi:chromosome segregation ATPase